MAKPYTVTTAIRMGVIRDWYSSDAIVIIAARHGVSDATVRRIWLEAARTRVLPAGERPKGKQPIRHGANPCSGGGISEDLDGDPLGTRPIRIPDKDPLLARLSGGLR